LINQLTYAPRWYGRPTRGLAQGLAALVSYRTDQSAAVLGAAFAAAALANAVFDATGVRLRTVPFTRQRVLAVYHVDRATGALSLKSVRHLQWDLLIEDYNSDKPTPREVHALVQPKQ
jgi:hypothetical protein